MSTAKQAQHSKQDNKNVRGRKTERLNRNQNQRHNRPAAAAAAAHQQNNRWRNPSPPPPYNSYRGSSNDSNRSNSNNNHRFIDYDLDHPPPPHVAPHYHHHHHNPPPHHFHQQSFYKEDVKEGTDVMERINNTLKRELKRRHLYDTETNFHHRLAVLTQLETLLTEWSASLSPESKSKVALISFGSFRLGVQSVDADIDALALCPPHVTRGDFFTSLVKVLGDDGRVTDLHPVPSAYTPVIKFYMDGIQIDLLFARLANGTKLQSLPSSSSSPPDPKKEEEEEEDDPTSPTSTVTPPNSTTTTTNHQPHPRYEFQITDEDLVGLEDEATVRSMNGVRVAQLLLSSVPNLPHFRFVLRAIKQWARVHGLYSNVLGFLGGVNWAILVAFICKRYPEASPFVLMRHFFGTFGSWRWPRPVRLVKVVYSPPTGGTFRISL